MKVCRLITILSVVILSGCASVVQIPASISEAFDPELGSLNTSELGDTLVSYQYAVTKPSYRIVSYEGKKPDVFNALKPGTVLEPMGAKNDIEFYRSPSADRANLLGFDSTRLCRQVSTDKWSHIDGWGDCTSTLFLFDNFENVIIERANWVDITAPNVQQQFIYNGRIDNYVKFTYREFSVGGYARDAFTQDVQYDLNEGNVIGFKGSRIEILEATNRVITYRVLSHFKGINL